MKHLTLSQRVKRLEQIEANKSLRLVQFAQTVTANALKEIVFQKKCEACRKASSQWELKDLAVSTTKYRICSNCLIQLVNKNLSPEQYNTLLTTGHKRTEFLLHGDFYNEKGNALQPGGIE